jgi:alkylation response protein AidB-like acyl-CoA dehydrogenase
VNASNPIPGDYSAFRETVREFLESALTPELARAGERTTSVFSDFEAGRQWQNALHARGWGAPEWPLEHGGTGWDIQQRYIFLEECRLANAPNPVMMGIQMLGPMLMHFGTEAQKATYLPGIISGDDVWCQGYSEPGSGSDLASLKTTADRDGDEYVVNGTKIWTSMAHYSNWIFCLVRTDKSAKPQAGISFLLIDMATPGITVTPFSSLDGEVEQCQVFFEDVRVPVGNLLGEENQGWTVAKYLLEFERGGQHFTIDLKKQLRKLQRLVTSDANAAAEDPTFAFRIAETEIDVMALEQTELRIKGSVAAGEHPGALSSLVKVSGTELGQQCAELLIEAAGQGAMPWQSEVLAPDYQGPTAAPEECVTTMAEYINSRATTIYGGTAEIQRGIIAKHVLGL